jgi:hypothetical protein
MGKDWHHDNHGSKMMFEDLIKKNEELAKDPDLDIDFITALIVGDKEKDGQVIW